MADKYRAGIIGCGWMGKSHAQAYAELENVTMAAAADIHPTSLAELQEEHGIPNGYADYHEMLANEDLDIISVCSWPGLHAPMTIAAAEAKVPGIICEKPMARTLAEADAMIAAAEEHGSKLVIGHQGRFRTQTNAIRSLIQDGAIGRVEFLYIQQSGGLSNSSIHNVDYARYILGDPKVAWVMGSVERRTDRYERAERIEDRAQALIGFAGGVRGVLESDIGDDRRVQPCIVYGSHGSIFPVSNGIRLLTTDGVREISFKEPNAQALQAKELIEWIEGRREHRGHAQNGRQALEVLLAISASTYTRGIVNFPLEITEYPLGLAVDEGVLPVEQPGAYDIRGYLVRKD
ncbi:MAG: Gfo/Idh/MocA family oxidoreductase [Chloroflexi bacterium]|nr:Gfo/Idh/MocA family oxidoreductase [Chloroflexota bacterium]